MLSELMCSWNDHFTCGIHLRKHANIIAFLSFLDVEIAQVIEILVESNGPINSTTLEKMAADDIFKWQ